MNESKKSKILIIALLYAINIWSQNSDSLVLCANTFALNSKFEESAEMYVAASDIDYNKGWLYEASKNYAKAKQKEKALSLLKRLSHLYYLDYDSLISTDVYFQYHHLREWQKIVKKVKKKSRLFKRDLIAKLDSITISDQKYRYLFESLLLDGSKDTVKLSWVNSMLDSIDSVNVIQVSNIIDTYGWLGHEEIGDDGCEAIILVILHSDYKTKKKYYPIFLSAFNKHKVFKPYKANYEDKLAMDEDRKQIYGTQFIISASGEKVFYPIDDIAKVNKRRLALGLDSIESCAKRNNVKLQ